MFNAIL